MDDINERSKELSEPEWVLAWRKKQLKLAEELPKELKYGIAINAVLPKNELGDHLAKWEGSAEYHVDASKGLEVYTWKEAVNQEEIAPILKGLMESEFFPSAGNYWSGVATALFRSGIVVYVQPNMNDKNEFVTEKLALDTKVPTGNSSDLVIVIMKEGARFEMTSTFSGGGSDTVATRTFLVLTERDAKVSITQSETLAKGTMLMLRSEGVVSAHSSCEWREVLSGNADINSETRDLLVGESAKGVIAQAVIAMGDTQYDIYASAKHLASDTTSTIRTAGVTTGNSKTVYRGLIDIGKNVARVDGSQEAKFLVLSKTAKVDAIPSLDIGSNDVRTSHKLSITHVKDGDVFYPKLRGLSDDESKRLFLEAMFAGLFPEDENSGIIKDIGSHLDAIGDPHSHENSG